MKRVTDMKGPQHTTAWALLFNGKFAGKLIANWSDNRNCTGSVLIWAGPLDMKENKGFDFSIIGRAGGYGYDKLSQVVWQCFEKSGVKAKVVRPANGESRAEFEHWGYEVCEII